MSAGERAETIIESGGTEIKGLVMLLMTCEELQHGNNMDPPPRRFVHWEQEGASQLPGGSLGRHIDRQTACVLRPEGQFPLHLFVRWTIWGKVF